MHIFIHTEVIVYILAYIWLHKHFTLYELSYDYYGLLLMLIEICQKRMAGQCIDRDGTITKYKGWESDIFSTDPAQQGKKSGSDLKSKWRKKYIYILGR